MVGYEEQGLMRSSRWCRPEMEREEKKKKREADEEDGELKTSLLEPQDGPDDREVGQ